MFADHLDRQGLTENVTVLVLWGESCSDITYAILQERYPNARFIFEYTLAEIGGCLAQSTDACAKATHTKHIDNDGYFVEIEDGELIVTTLSLPSSFPFIRYRTGDAARFMEDACPCGRKGQVIELQGRIGGDFVRIAGAEVRAEELERVLMAYAPYIEPTYQLEIREIKRGNTRLAVLNLLITKRSGISIDENVLRERIAISMMDKFRLSQNMNLKSAVAMELFEPLTVSLRSKLAPNMKHQRLVQIL
jgi:phenylacetate-coenzyme A ligase PaaK-like adenylate-forming protein